MTDMGAYYDRGTEEGRLADSGRLEFLRTRELLARFLPAPPVTVLDVGGAAGAYALPLAAEGYEVHLVDPVALHVEQALAASAAQPDAPLASAVVGDARALPFDDESADVVLLLGPLYHLTEAADRTRALREARRALRPGGLLAARPSRASPRPSTPSPRAFCSSPASRRSSSATSPTAGTATPTGTPAGSPPPISTAPTSSSARSRTPASKSPRSWPSRARSAPRPRRAPSTPGSTIPASREVLLRAIRRVEAEPSLLGAGRHCGGRYSTVTVLARLRGWSTFSPRRRAIR